MRFICFLSLLPSRLNDSKRMHYSIPMKVLLVVRGGSPHEVSVSTIFEIPSLDRKWMLLSGRIGLLLHHQTQRSVDAASSGSVANSYRQQVLTTTLQAARHVQEKRRLPR